jgi:hypothetical protein
MSNKLKPTHLRGKTIDEARYNKFNIANGNARKRRHRIDGADAMHNQIVESQKNRKKHDLTKHENSHLIAPPNRWHAEKAFEYVELKNDVANVDKLDEDIDASHIGAKIASNSPEEALRISVLLPRLSATFATVATRRVLQCTCARKLCAL